MAGPPLQNKHEMSHQMGRKLMVRRRATLLKERKHSVMNENHKTNAASLTKHHMGKLSPLIRTKFTI